MEGCKYPNNCLSNHKCYSCDQYSGRYKYCEYCDGGRNYYDFACRMKSCSHCNKIHKCIVCNRGSGIHTVCDDCVEYSIPELAC